MSRFVQAKGLISYFLNAVGKHSLHSPFIFEFYTKVLTAPNYNSFPEIELLRMSLMKNQETILVNELGAGSKVNKDHRRKVAKIAETSLSSPKFSALYCRMINFFSPDHIIELGTSLGINTLYLAQNPPSKVTTFEGCHNLAQLAQQNFDHLDKKNIELIVGDIDKTLPTFVAKQQHIDFAFVDANHRFAPTLAYFEVLLKKATENSIFIFDDIHWSSEMERAWNVISNHPSVSLSIDLYKCGIVFFRNGKTPEHYVLEF